MLSSQVLSISKDEAFTTSLVLSRPIVKKFFLICKLNCPLHWMLLISSAIAEVA